jgi:hypothetical protein
MFKIPAYDPFAIAVMGLGILLAAGVCISALIPRIALVICQSSNSAALLASIASANERTFFYRSGIRGDRTTTATCI